MSRVVDQKERDILMNTNDHLQDPDYFIDLDALKKDSMFFGIKKFSDSSYTGEMVDNKREGQGIMEYDNGRHYTGRWLNDLRDGMGIEVYQNGNVFKGTFKRGKANGKGIYIWKHLGEVYDGDWLNG
jgi:hypothetical protein